MICNVKDDWVGGKYIRCDNDKITIYKMPEF